MNFLEELRWRGMLHDATPGVEDILDQGPVTGYIGFDPTAASLGLGNYVQIMLLTLFQRAGHQPIALVGGATGRIGDPAGKDKERTLKSYEELDRNLAKVKEQLIKYVGTEAGKFPVILVNNHDFYRNMNVLDFLRDVGKTLTVNYMMSKDSVKNRLESGLSFTEFSYQLLQAYDYQCLYKDHGCRLQMGGSDQWGNITSGTEFIRRNLDGKAYAVTTPLLTKADGTKFGKSEKGNIFLDGDMTSPYEFYQFWINADDGDVPKFTRYFTFRSKEEVEALEAQHRDNPRELKRLLAEELTIRIHGPEQYEAVQKVSNLLFNNRSQKEDLLGLDLRSLATIAREISSYQLPMSLLQNGLNIVELLAEHTPIVHSKADARRAIQGQAVSVNKDKISNHEATVTADQLLHGKYLMIENGKKNKFMIEVVRH